VPSIARRVPERREGIECAQIAMSGEDHRDFVVAGRLGRLELVVVGADVVRLPRPAVGVGDAGMVTCMRLPAVPPITPVSSASAVPACQSAMKFFVATVTRCGLNEPVTLRPVICTSP
jgi:hypothetical protein